jgi:hypothetical protein
VNRLNRNLTTGIADCCVRAASASDPGTAEQRDELAALIKKTSSHETIAKCVGLTKRPRST